MPVIHYALNYDFYKNVLCENKAKPEFKCNGKCHLAKEITASQGQDDTSDVPVPRIELSKLPISVIENIPSYNLLVCIHKKKTYHKYLDTSLNAIYLNIVTPPPNNC